MNQRNKLKVYIATPYTYPDPAKNVNRAIKVANQLVDAGYIPHVPILYHLWHLITPRKYEDWMRLDKEWLKCCDVAIRLPGKSSGADRDIKLAKKLGIPIKKLKDLLNENTKPLCRNWGK